MMQMHSFLFPFPSAGLHCFIAAEGDSETLWFVADLDALGSRGPHPDLWVPCQAACCGGQIPAWEKKLESFHAACLRTSRNTLHQCLMQIKCHSVKEGSACLLAICWCYVVCQTARVKAKRLMRGKPWRRTELLKEGL